MTSNRTIALGASSTLALSFLLVQPAQAEDAAAAATPPASSGGLSEIVVTAQKRVERLQDVPVAVTAVQGAELRAVGIDSVKILPAVTPSLSVFSNASAMSPFIRGIGSTFAQPGLEASVSTYIDDLYLSRSFVGFLTFNDVERIEVLKGPQGILFGRNATGGAIRIVLKDTTQAFHMGGGITAGNFGAGGGDAYVSGSLTNNLEFRLAGQYNFDHGWAKPYIAGINPGDNRNEYVVRGKLKWRPSDRLTIALSSDYYRGADRTGLEAWPLFPGAPAQTGDALGGVSDPKQQKLSTNWPGPFDNHFGRLTRTLGGVELRADYDFDSFTLSSITGYRYSRDDGGLDLDATSAIAIQSFQPFSISKDFSQEVQAVSTNSGPFSWTAGVFYWQERGANDSYVNGNLVGGAVGLGPDFVSGGRGHVRIHAISAYGQGSYKILPGLELVAGGRVTRDARSADDDTYTSTIDLNTGAYTSPIVFTPICSATVAANCLPLAAARPPHANTTHFDPKVGINWRPMKDLLLYASYTTAFKAGGYNGLGTPATSIDVVKNETNKAIEVGWKGQLGNKIRFNGAYFHYNLSNLQEQVNQSSLSNNTSFNILKNAGKAKVDGVEMDVTVSPVRNLELGAGVTWMNARFVDYANDPVFRPCAYFAVPSGAGVTYPTDISQQCAALGGLGLGQYNINAKGNPLPNAPKWAGYLRAAYTLPVTGVGAFNATVIGSYKGRTNFDATTLYYQRAYWVMNATLGWKSENGHWGIGGYATNLTNKRYVLSKNTFALTGGWMTYAAPREYGVRLSFDY